MSYPVNTQQPYVPQMQPVASCGAVSINIMNPTVGYQYPMYGQNGYLYQYPQGSYYSNMPTNAAQYPQNYNNTMNVSNPINTINNNNSAIPAPMAATSGAAAATAAASANATDETSKENKTDENKKEEEPKTKVNLTDDYIKSLENYLNSQDAKVRLIAAKEVLERFKEDDTRKEDPALCALLNKILQDPNSAVRFVGLTVMDVGYAKGNEETIGILKNIQASNQTNETHEDSLLSSQILLKLSAGDKVPLETQKEAK